MSGEQTTDDRYVLEERIGSGGMATVWRAHDALLDRTVVVKRMHPHLAADPAAAERFRNEALTAAALAHPGVVTIYDAGEDEEGPYLVMEHVAGESLADVLRREGRLPPERVGEVGAAVAEALAAAHDRGIVHRDVKPSNVLLDESGRVMVADFGIARSLDASTRLTGTGTLVGTAAYVAPEVAGGEEASPASDLYSLGVVLYEALTGRTPFEGETPLAGAAWSPGRLGGGRAAGRAGGGDHALPGEGAGARYASAAELAGALATWWEAEPTRALGVAAPWRGEVPETACLAVGERPTAPEQATARSAPPAWVAGVAARLAAAGDGIRAWWGRRGRRVGWAAAGLVVLVALVLLLGAPGARGRGAGADHHRRHHGDHDDRQHSGRRGGGRRPGEGGEGPA